MVRCKYYVEAQVSVRLSGYAPVIIFFIILSQLWQGFSPFPKVVVPDNFCLVV